MTKKLIFAKEIQQALNHERYHHPSPIVQKRMETLWLKSHDLPHWQIAQLAGECENTMRSHFALYEEGGIEKLKKSACIVRKVSWRHTRPRWKPISKPTPRRRSARRSMKLLN
jgi:hypothetical protein